MKSKILLISVFILCLFIIVGCGNQEEKPSNDNNEITSSTSSNDLYVTIGEEKFKLKNSTSLGKMHFLENYVDFYNDRMGNVFIMSYSKAGKYAFELRVLFEEEHSIDEVKAVLAQYEEKIKEINGITYAYYEYSNENGDTIHNYVYEYEGKPYSIIFFLGENSGDIEEVFMNNVYFE